MMPLSELKEASEKLREGDELTLETWMTAVGDVDLREMFPGQTNGIVKQIGIEKEAWVAPTEEQQRQINREILARIQKDSVGKVKLGLDLRGGTQFVVQVKPKLDDEGNPLSIDESQLTKAMEIMRRRVDKFGVAEPMIQTSGEDKIVIQVPGLSQADRDDARETISQVAKLEFRLTHPQSDELVAEGAEFEPGAELMSYDLDGRKVYHFVMTEVAMSGSHIKRASAAATTSLERLKFTSLWMHWAPINLLK